MDNILLKYTLKSLIESFKYTLKSFLQKNIVHTFINLVLEHLKRLEKLPKELGKLKTNLKFLVRKKLENLVEILKSLIYNL